MDISLGERVIRELFLCPKCENCGEELFDKTPFCRVCGQPDKKFSTLAFEADMGCSIQEIIKKECQQGHKGNKENYEKNDPEFYLENPYCPYCGEKFDFI